MKRKLLFIPGLNWEDQSWNQGRLSGRDCAAASLDSPALSAEVVELLLDSGLNSEAAGFRIDRPGEDTVPLIDSSVKLAAAPPILVDWGCPWVFFWADGSLR